MGINLVVSEINIAYIVAFIVGLFSPITISWWMFVRSNGARGDFFISIFSIGTCLQAIAFIAADGLMSLYILFIILIDFLGVSERTTYSYFDVL